MVKIKEDAALHYLIRDVEINDDTGLLHPKQCDFSKIYFNNPQFKFQQRD